MRLMLTIPDSPDPETQAWLLRTALTGMVSINRWILRHHTEIPALYESGIKFRSEPAANNAGYDEIPDILTMYLRGYGDCAPLAAARAAELLEAGDNASIKVYWRPNRMPLPFHAQVRRGNGEIEDPARRLGMVGRAYE